MTTETTYKWVWGLCTNSQALLAVSVTITLCVTFKLFFSFFRGKDKKRIRELEEELKVTKTKMEFLRKDE